MLRNRKVVLAPAKPERFRPVVGYWLTDEGGRTVRIPRTDPRWTKDCPPLADDIFDTFQLAVDPEHCRLGLGPCLVRRYGDALAATDRVYSDVVTAVRDEDAARAEIIELQQLILRACEGARLNLGNGDAIREAELLGRKEMRNAAKAAKALSAALAKSPQVMNWPLWLATDRSKIRVQANVSPAEPDKHAFARTLATWLSELGEVLETADHQWLPPRPVENLIGVRRPDKRLRVVGLAFEVAVHIKNATSPIKRRARAVGFPMYKAGKPHWPIVAEFVNAALGETMTGDQCKIRVMNFLKSNKPLTEEPGDKDHPIVKTSVRLWSRGPRGRDRI